MLENICVLWKFSGGITEQVIFIHITLIIKNLFPQATSFNYYMDASHLHIIISIPLAYHGYSFVVIVMF